MVELLFTGDTGSGNESQSQVSKSMSGLIRQHRSIKAIIIVGDNIYESGCSSINDPQFITKFRKPYHKIKKKFYLCLGNHDYGDQINNSQVQIDYTLSKQNLGKKWNLPSKWYVQSFPICDLFFIDTNFDRLSVDEIQTQFNDIITAIQTSNKQWKVLCGHHTWKSVGGHGNASSDLDRFLKAIFSKCDIDIYICGHDHCKSIIEVPFKNRIIPTLVIGTGGKIYGDDNIFNLHNLSSCKSTLLFYSPNLGVCHMKATKSALNFTCYNEELKKEYSYTLNK